MSLRRLFRRRRNTPRNNVVCTRTLPVFRPHFRLSRGALLAGTSAMALVLAAPNARAITVGASNGGGTVMSAPNTAVNTAQSAAQQGAANAQAAMARVSHALQSLQSVQAAARAAAQASQRSSTLPAVNVPNGLGAGGLDPNPVAGWSGANAPTQSTGSGGQTNVTVQQTQAQAILNWKTFNVGTNTTLTFDQQGNATWVALNRVDSTTGPSQILGNIKADGQVYVINQSGIIFGGASQINVGSLIASTANITDTQFQTSGIYSTQTGSLYTPSFTDAGGKIIVESGAQITTNAPSSTTSSGGYVLLMGTEVDNAGAITTPGGQTMLAAGNDFVLRPGVGTDGNKSSTTRGSEIATGTWTSTPGGSGGTWVSGGGIVDNSGLIFSQQGDITLAGHTVVQDGVLLSTTSVNQRGTIHLLNSASDTTGSVTLTGDSVTAILPELDSTDTALDSKRDALIADSASENLVRASSAIGQFDNLSVLADREDESRIEIVTGGLVDFQNGSLTQAQGGQVAVSAGQRVFVETGATIDVSGVQDVGLAMSSNEFLVNIQGNELRDSPQNRDSGDLLNANVWVDARDLILVPAGTGGDTTDRYYTAGGLLEVSGYLANTEHTIGEWTAVGGTITLSAPEVIAQQGSTFNISGGSLQYQSGWLNDTALVGSNGLIYDVNNAPADITYQAVASGFVVDHQRAGVIEVYANLVGGNKGGSYFEQGYTVGRSAGQLILSTPTAVFEGDVVANVITGGSQTSAPPAGVTDGYKYSQDSAPLAGTIALGEYNASGLFDAYNTAVVFGSAGADVAGAISATDALPSNVVNTAYFSAPAISSFGLGGVNIATNGSITVNAPLNFAPGAQVTLTAPNVDIAANITAPSGNVTVTNFLQPDLAGQIAFALTTSTGTSQLALDSGATINVAGLLVNAQTDPASVNQLAFLNGGTVTFDSTQNVTLASGSTINVSSGGAILANGKMQGGTGGNVTLTAGHPSGNLTAPATLTMDGTITAYGVNGGGTLTVNDPGTILIGDNASLEGGVLGAGTPAPIAVTLLQDLTIPAGQPLPASFLEKLTSLAPGVPAPVAIAPVNNPQNLFNVAEWTVPDGLIVFVGSTRYGGGNGASNIVPANSQITAMQGSIAAGQSIDPDAFPNGLPVQPYQVFLTAGSIQSTPTTYPAGTTIAAGSVLPQAVAIQAAQPLNPALFSSGFANYVIDGEANVFVADGTALAPTMPVYQFTAASFAAPTGSDPALAMSVWTPPLFTENVLNGTLTQRGGASLTLLSTTTKQNIPTGGTVTVGDGASITVDPGQSITLSSFGQLTVDGSLTAHGGNISLTNGIQINYDVSTGAPLGISTWIGGDAVLDVSGEVYTAGHPYGVVTNGGSININGGNSFVVIRPGAELDADGAAGAISLAAGSPNTPTQIVTVASNGGSISLSSNSGIYNDGDLHAFAGGAGAAGGSLAIDLDTAVYQDPNNHLPSATPVPGAPLTPGIMTVVQSQTDSGLPADITPGSDVSSLAIGRATVSANAVQNGGFDSLTLSSRDYLVFSDDVKLNLGQSLTLSAGAFASGAPQPTAPDSGSAPVTGTVILSAPYVLLTSPSNPAAGSSNGSIGAPFNRASNPTTATFEVDADQIDVQGTIIFGPNAKGFSPGFETVTLNSQGDIRFLAPDSDQGTTTSLTTAWNIDLVAGQIYPGTNALAVIVAGDNPQELGTLTISRNDSDLDPAVPASIFGQLFLSAPTIEQGGIVRAPFGTIDLGNGHGQATNVTTQKLDLLAGSITSVSADGLTIPYGGTTDGVTYNYDGTAVSSIPVASNSGAGGRGLTLDSVSINVQQGAVVDVSGGGTITGAGFISGRGGSVDVLTTPLINANPTTPVSRAGDKVYAIVPGYASAYAPIAAAKGAGDPAIGQQITIPAGVPGLPAGTYTLLPSNYALLPGAYRVELGGATNVPVTGASAIGNGTYVTSGYTGIANTNIKSALPSLVLVTPGAAVRNYSQYDEQSYSDFMTATAALVGSPRPQLPIDASILNIALEVPATPPATPEPVLTFGGTALMQGATGGYGGTLAVTAFQFGSQGPAIEIYNDAPTQNFAGVSISAQALDAIAAPRMIIGGTLAQGNTTTSLNGNITFVPNGVLNVTGGASAVYIRPDVDLEAGEIFIGASGTIDVGANAKLSTVGQGAAPYDSSDGYVYQASSTLLALSNGNLDFIGTNGNNSGGIVVEAGAKLFSEGTLAFAAKGLSTIDPTAQFGSRNLTLAAGTVNIGDSSAIAAAGAPTGLLFDQDLFDRLVSGDPSNGAPALQTLTLAASSAVNLFGSASLDATGSGINLVLTTPAIYGYGTAADQATISAGKITWNSAAGTQPSGFVGDGLGTLNLKAGEIDLGQFVSLDATTSSRTIYGFSNVNLIASSQIVSAGNSSLYVYQAPSTTAGDVFGQTGTGGNLTISTPLLTGVQKSVMDYTAGGALSVTAPAGETPSTATSTIGGAEIDLNADTVTIASTILLPSGKLVVNATNDVTLAANSRIDVSGQPSMIQDATVYGFGGTVSLNSTQGGVTQAEGAVIDVSATNANAGSISVYASSGMVSLDGNLNGAADAGYTSGDFSVTAATLDDFTALNGRLTQGGVFDARTFDIKTGDLVIDDGVTAHNVTVSVDAGTLTVNGTIDASGASPGTIRLSAKGDLIIASSGVLDAHGTVLQVDSYGQPIEAKNSGYIELASTQGTLTLASGATIDLRVTDSRNLIDPSHPDAPNNQIVNYGEIELNAARGTVGSSTQSAGDETSGDIKIQASGPLKISGAQSIAVNGFWTYSPTDQYGTIVQDNGSTLTPGVAMATNNAQGEVGLAQIDNNSQLFINNALGNQNLLGRLAGLSAYTNAFHLRPGVEIDGTPSTANPTGMLTVAGDLDLSGFRYTSLNPNFQKTGVYGSGEPGALVIRASGNLDIVGSISDGFMPAPTTSDANGWVLTSGIQSSSIETLLPVAINSGTTFPNTAGLSLRYNIPINAATISAGAVIPTQVTLSGSVTLPAGTRLTAALHEPDGTTLNVGTVITVATVLPAGTLLDAGSIMPGNIGITAMNWPAGANLGVFTSAVTLNGNITVPYAGIIPSGANVQLADPTTPEPTRPTGTSGTQGSFDAIAAMLPQGELSWSERLVSGADLSAADTRIVKPLSALKASGVSGNLTLVDGHVVSKTATNYYYYVAEYPGGVILGKYPGKATGGGLYCSAFYCTPAPSTFSQAFGVAEPSVVRTGTGNLDLIAGGSFSEQSLFGVYTAGTQSAPILDSNGKNNYNQPRGLGSDGTLLGAANADQAAAVATANQAWYPEHGGDVLVSAQGNLTGNIATSNVNGNDPTAITNRFVDSDAIGNWLWRQGGGGLANDPTAWWINFGTYAQTDTQAGDASFLGFQGIGTLGGGNLTVIAGGNAGLLSANASTGLDLAVASTGRVLPDGTLIQTGGGDLTVKIGGTLNPVNPNTATNLTPDSFGSIADLRGNIVIQAGAVGEITTNLFADGFTSIDPRPLPQGTIKQTTMTAGPIVTPGDGTVSIATRGDLAFGGAGDAGFVQPLDANGTSFTLINPDGSTTFVPGGGTSSFTLWRPTTSIMLYSAGGDVAPLTASFDTLTTPQNGVGFYPGTLIVAAANGDIRFQDPFASSQGTMHPLELLPSPVGQLELLAAGTIYGADQIIGMSGADMSTLATPLHPVFMGGGGLTNASPTSLDILAAASTPLAFPSTPIAFGQDTPTTNLHAGDNQPILIYAGVDIDDLTVGQVQDVSPQPGTPFLPTLNTWYLAAKPVQMIAGRDIVGRGLTPDVFFNNDANDISLVQAGRDIFYQSVTITGRGLLEVQAGRNLYQASQGQFISAGGQIGADRTSLTDGAGITVLAGVGANGPDYVDFAKLYFNPANQLPDDGTPLAGSGKVAHTYNQELLTWLQQRYGYTGTADGALSFFLGLPGLDQGVFVRQIYYEELTLSGREETGAIASTRLGSYARGREAIAALFPTQDAGGNPITYNGGITMFSALAKNAIGATVTNDSGIYTQRGGDIQILDPGGEVVVGVDGTVPGSNAGLITGGLNADIDIYSEGSVLLGQSRIMTTFGGDIMAWSAEGDINAGRGSKTTQIFVLPLQIYDMYGNITLSPPTTASGAGIAALDPLAGVAPGNVDLIAPLGTIDAGEAGIRVSGNVNLAALQVVNAANITVQGTSTGVPTVQGPPVAALVTASNTTAGTQQTGLPTQSNNGGQASVMIVEIIGYGGSQDTDENDDARKRRQQ